MNQGPFSWYYSTYEHFLEIPKEVKLLWRFIVKFEIVSSAFKVLLLSKTFCFPYHTNFD